MTPYFVTDIIQSDRDFRGLTISGAYAFRDSDPAVTGDKAYAWGEIVAAGKKRSALAAIGPYDRDFYNLLEESRGKRRPFRNINWEKR